MLLKKISNVELHYLNSSLNITFMHVLRIGNTIQKDFIVRKTFYY